MKAKKPKRFLVRSGITIAIVAAVGSVLVMLLPRSFDGDLSKLGKGQPAAVLVYDPSFLISSEMTQSLNAIRSRFEPRMLFLIADLNVPQGRRLAEEPGAVLGALLLFDEQGKRLDMYAKSADAAALGAFLEKHYGDAVAGQTSASD